MADAAIPGQKTKNLRACLLCSVVQSAADFRRMGCPNCEEILQVYFNFILCACGVLMRVQRCVAHRTALAYAQRHIGTAWSLW
jgi:hypothetical protein